MSQDDDEDFMISPIKIDKPPRSRREKQNAPAVSALDNMRNSRAQGSGSGSTHRAYDASAMVNSIVFLHFKRYSRKKNPFPKSFSGIR